MIKQFTVRYHRVSSTWKYVTLSYTINRRKHFWRKINSIIPVNFSNTATSLFKKKLQPSYTYSIHAILFSFLRFSSHNMEEKKVKNQNNSFFELESEILNYPNNSKSQKKFTHSFCVRSAYTFCIVNLWFWSNLI